MKLPHGFTDGATSALPLHVLERTQFSDWCATQTTAVQAWLDAQGFNAAPGSVVLLPGEHGVAGAVLGVGDAVDPYSYAHAPHGLPPGDWTLASTLADDARIALQLGWGLGSYRFDRYRKLMRAPARLLLDAASADAEALDVLAACVRVRDLVNTPPN